MNLRTLTLEELLSLWWIDEEPVVAREICRRLVNDLFSVRQPVRDDAQPVRILYVREEL